jgi:hypothetical protein
MYKQTMVFDDLKLQMAKRNHSIIHKNCDDDHKHTPIQNNTTLKKPVFG